MPETHDMSFRRCRSSSCSLGPEVDTQSNDSSSRGSEPATTERPPAEPEVDIKSALQDTIDELCDALDATRTIISGSVANDAWKTTLKTQSINKRARTTLLCSSGQLGTASFPSPPPPAPALPCTYLQADQHYVDLTASSHAMCPHNTRCSHAPCNNNCASSYSPDKDAPSTLPPPSPPPYTVTI